MSTANHSTVVDLPDEVASRKLLRTFRAIGKAWNLSETEQAILLTGSAENLASSTEETPYSALSEETLRRLSYILNIYAALHTLLPVPERANAWVREPNSAALFGGATALHRMLGGNTNDIEVVFNYLQSQLNP